MHHRSRPRLSDPLVYSVDRLAALPLRRGVRALGGGAQGYPAVLVRRHEVYPALPGPPLRLSVDPELFPRLPNLRLLAAAMLKAEAALYLYPSRMFGCRHCRGPRHKLQMENRRRCRSRGRSSLAKSHAYKCHLKGNLNCSAFPHRLMHLFTVLFIKRE